MTNIGAINLASAVLYKAIDDYQGEDNGIALNVKRDVDKGNLDLYLTISNLKLTRAEFLEKLKKMRRLNSNDVDEIVGYQKQGYEIEDISKIINVSVYNIKQFLRVRKLTTQYYKHKYDNPMMIKRVSDIYNHTNLNMRDIAIKAETSIRTVSKIIKKLKEDTVNV